MFHGWWPDAPVSGMIGGVERRRRVGRGVLISTVEAEDLSAPKLPRGVDVGWAVSELFEAAWIASGRDPADLVSPRLRAASEAAGVKGR